MMLMEWVPAGLIGVGAVAFFWGARAMKRAQDQWFKFHLEDLHVQEENLKSDIKALAQNQDRIREHTTQLRRRYQLVSRLARTLSVEKTCRELSAFLKEEVPHVEGQIELICGTQMLRFDLASGAFLHAATPERNDSMDFPLAYGDRALGRMRLIHASSEDVARVEQYIGQIQLTFATAILYEETRTRAITDALTGTAVRWYFEDRLQQDILFAKAAQQTLGLLMIDIDHFKKINDTYGHAAGDAVLAAVGRALMNVCRETDLVARYGGEEFSVIAPATRDDGLSALAERFRSAVESLDARAPDGDRRIPVTISIGGAIWEPSLNMDPASLISAADKNLYAAKHAGRNRAVIP